MALTRIGGLWKNKGKGYSGRISIAGGGSVTLKDGDRIAIFANDKEGNEQRPDVTLHIDKDAPTPTPKKASTQDDDIPF